jgi:hypothetical protein
MMNFRLNGNEENSWLNHVQSHFYPIWFIRVEVMSHNQFVMYEHDP